MALITVSGDPGCRLDEVARLTAGRLECALVTESSLDELIAREFGIGVAIPDGAWPQAATLIVGRMAVSEHVVMATVGCELLFPGSPGVLRVKLIGPKGKPHLRKHLGLRRRRFGKIGRGRQFDLTMNVQSFTPEEMAGIVEAAVRSAHLLESGPLKAASDVTKREFSHPTEEIFAKVLDFYQIAWEYEPRSFPLQWDKDGKVTEAFTPDFYLPQFELFVELTAMKQALVTRKNRKIRLLRAIYPHVNVQVLYQKDLQDLIMKYGAPGT